ncbi:restriction endonuclease subunit S [Candidatus Saccharibacteria bacterium]|nr:restriction endonuclease subunit S [Candidatus Saccharibacteria bacterium]
MKKVLLGDIIELAYGKSLPQRSRIPGRFPVFGSNGQVDTHNKSLVGGPGIIIGRKGSVGEVIWSKQNFWPIDTTYYVKLKNPDNDLRYWYYVLKTLGLNKLNSHSAIPGLNRDIAYIKLVPLRSMLEQKKIADILGSLDEKIELNRRMNETFEQLGQALFRHYFVDNSEVDSWESGEVSDVVRIYSGFAFKSKDFDIGGRYGLVTIKNVQDGSFIKDCADHLSEPLPDKTPEHVHLKSGDIDWKCW